MEIFKIGHEKLYTEEGESNKEAQEFTTSSDMSEQDSEYDTTTDDENGEKSTTSTQISKESSKYDTSTEDEEESQTTEPLQIHNVCNTTIHNEDDSIHDEDESSNEEHVTEIETHTDNGERNNIQENKLYQL